MKDRIKLLKIFCRHPKRSISEKQQENGVAKEKENLRALLSKRQAKKVEPGNKATTNKKTEPSRKLEESRQIPSKTTESPLKKSFIDSSKYTLIFVRVEVCVDAYLGSIVCVRVYLT